MSKFKIQPVNIKRGSKAPYFVEEAKDTEAALKLAPSLTNLLDSPLWNVEVTELSNNPKTKKSYVTN